jgi:hypothetical protein
MLIFIRAQAQHRRSHRRLLTRPYPLLRPKQKNLPWCQRNNRRSVPRTAPTLDFIGPDRLPPAEPSHFGVSPGLNHSLSDCLILVFVPG